MVEAEEEQEAWFCREGYVCCEICMQSQLVLAGLLVPTVLQEGAMEAILCSTGGLHLGGAGGLPGMEEKLGLLEVLGEEGQALYLPRKALQGQAPSIKVLGAVPEPALIYFRILQEEVEAGQGLQGHGVPSREEAMVGREE
jgi:hypothetical protein